MAKIDDDLGEFGDIVSLELATAFKDAIDLLSILIPVGEITPIMVNIPGVPTPDPNIWQECNGSQIINPDSPLTSLAGISRFTPDMTERYLKVPLVFGQSGQQGGVNVSGQFAHNHTGETGDYTSPEDTDQSNAVQEAAFVHRHTIASDLPSVPVQPPFYTVKFFMRIQ